MGKQKKVTTTELPPFASEQFAQQNPWIIQPFRLHCDLATNFADGKLYCDNDFFTLACNYIAEHLGECPPKNSKKFCSQHDCTECWKCFFRGDDH